jgi:hypothetical protein
VIEGRCICGQVRFEVRAPFEAAGYCHCRHCQRRSGSAWGAGARVAAEGVVVTAGEQRIRTWVPDSGKPKHFCSNCGGHLFAGERTPGSTMGVRLGTLEGDPGIRPEYRQWVESSPEWEPIPDDGLPRYSRGRP